MRVTNQMIMKNAGSNINAVKELVSTTNDQMTNQKKIQKPSDDPVIAVRSLRLSTQLTKVNQYYEKNIPDAESWLDVSETALTNMTSMITTMRTLCDKGANGEHTNADRQTIKEQLQSLQEQIYKEGNADFAGRTVFTGFRTDSDLAFTTDETDTEYNIDQTLSFESIDTKIYNSGSVTVPSTSDEISQKSLSIPDLESSTYDRIRLAYDLSKNDKVGTYAFDTASNSYVLDDSKINCTYTDADGNTQTTEIALSEYSSGGTNTTPDATNALVFNNEDDWLEWSKTQTKDDGSEAKGKYVPDNGMVIIKDTGEIVMGHSFSADLISKKASVNLSYDKTGFKNGELRPEFYYDCNLIKNKGSVNDPPIKYERFDENGNAKSYNIDYTVSQNQTLSVNLEASDIFDMSILQDMRDMTDSVTAAIDANDKVTKIQNMLNDSRYQDTDSQDKLNQWLSAAKKEADLADNQMQTLYSKYIGHCSDYLEKMTQATTKLGCKSDQLDMIKKRMSEQQETVKDLQSKNDDLDISEIILKYTSAYTAYQSSLTAAGRLGQQTLLNYI